MRIVHSEFRLVGHEDLLKEGVVIQLEGNGALVGIVKVFGCSIFINILVKIGKSLG